jgi:hypothetical protein
VSKPPEERTQTRIGTLVEEKSQDGVGFHSLLTNAILGVDRVAGVLQNGLHVING